MRGADPILCFVYIMLCRNSLNFYHLAAWDCMVSGRSQGLHGLRDCMLSGRSQGLHGLKDRMLSGRSQGLHGLRDCMLMVSGTAWSQGLHGLRDCMLMVSGTAPATQLD